MCRQGSDGGSVLGWWGGGGVGRGSDGTFCRSADFPVRSNVGTSHGFKKIVNSPSYLHCCGLESPRSDRRRPESIFGPLSATPRLHHSIAPFLSLLLLIFLSFGFSQRAGAQPLVGQIIITNIGPAAVSEGLIRANIHVKEGQPYSRPAVDDDIRNLYATGYFEDIRVKEQPTPGGVDLVYYVEGKLKLTDIVFVGNKKFSTSKLKKKLTSKIGEPLDERKLFTDSEEIKKMYQKSGYPQTKITYKVDSDQRAGVATATFEITESPKVKILDVYFEGGHVFSQRKLRHVVKTRRHWMFSWLTGGGVLKEEQLDEDKEKLAEFYRDAGYIDFELKDVRYVYETPRKLVLHFVISEGTRYRVGAINFTGVTLFPTNDIAKKLRMMVGSIFTPKGLTRDLEIVQDYYGAKGYIDMVPRAQKNANTQMGTIDLVYEIEEGGKSYIEKIEIKGNTKTKDRVIRRELSVSPGEVFDMVKVKLSKQRLEGTQLFEAVDTQPEPTDVPNRKNLLVAVKETSTGHLSFGAGFSSVDSILGFIEVTQGNFDLFNPPWFMGGGQKFRLKVQIGARREDYEASFIEPWFLGKKLQLSVDLFHRDLRFLSVNNLYEERLSGATIGLTRALGSDFLIGSVNYTIESVGIFNVPSNAPPELRTPVSEGGEEGTRLVSKVGLSLAYDTRNSTLLPNRGQFTTFRTEVAVGPLGGDSDFYKLELRTSRYIKGFFEGHVLELGAGIGVVDRYGNSQNVPLFDRWYLGGIDSLRGYRYREVGPRYEAQVIRQPGFGQAGGFTIIPPNNEPHGGDTYWVGTAEYSVPIIDFVRFAVFYDIGMVYLDPYSFQVQTFGVPKGANKLYNDNYGFGLRLNIPHLGPLRLDYGIPITSDPANRSSGRFQFSVGYTRPF